MEKTLDDDSGISTESCECKPGLVLSDEIDSKIADPDPEDKLAVKPSLFSKIAKLPYKIKVEHILLVVVAIVWGLLTLPILFYHLPVDSQGPSSNTILLNSTASECSTAVSYPIEASTMCRDVLKDILLSLNCNSEGLPLVLRADSDTITNANLLIPSLSTLNPTPQCIEAAIPFLCLYLFGGLCDSQTASTSIQPTSAQCKQVRDDLCSTEWEIAGNFVMLPDCANLPVEQVRCKARNESEPSDRSSSGSGFAGVQLEPKVEESTEPAPSEQLECREGFFRENTSDICQPSCFTWQQYSRNLATFIDVVVFLSAFIGFWTAIAVFVISFIRYKRMFVFPSSFILFKTLDLLVLSFFVIVNFMDRDSLFCSAMSIFDSRMITTPFCVISGMVFTYTLVQLATWWLMHTMALFWKVKFPFHSRSFQMTHKIKYLHAACIIAGILIPLVPIIASVADSAVDYNPAMTNISFLNSGLGYSQTRFPPILCTGNDGDVVFYSVVLPIDIALAVGCALLIYIFWIIHKQHGLFKANEPGSKSAFRIGTAERKVLIVFCYYIVLAVVALTTFTLATRNGAESAKRIFLYFACEQKGHDPEEPCSRSGFEELNFPTSTTLSYILLGMFPVVNLVYAVNIQELKSYCKCIMLRKIKFSFSDNPSTSSTGANSSTLKRV